MFIDRENEFSPTPILNRTQRRFTQMLSEDVFQQEELVYDKLGTAPNLSSYANNGASITDSLISSLDTQSFSSFDENDAIPAAGYNAYVNDTLVEEPVQQPELDALADALTIDKLPKYCRVNFDFHPENRNELGCFKGEYLKIHAKLSDDWIDCLNYYNKSGIVPANFVMLMDDSSFARDLFENQTRASTTSLNNNAQKDNGTATLSETIRHSMPVHELIPAYSPSFANNSSQPTLNVSLEHKYERSSSSGHVIDLKVPASETGKTRSLTPDMTGDAAKSIRRSGPKPPIPPKPKIAPKPSSNSEKKILNVMM